MNEQLNQTNNNDSQTPEKQSGQGRLILGDILFILSLLLDLIAAFLAIIMFVPESGGSGLILYALITLAISLGLLALSMLFLPASREKYLVRIFLLFFFLAPLLIFLFFIIA